MLTYSFDHIGKETLYEHLYNEIRQDIENGSLKAGEKLPSKRALAEHLSISTVTVENAYAQLATEGYIRSVPRSGFYVADIGSLFMQQKKKELETKPETRPKASWRIQPEAQPTAQAERRNETQESGRYFADFSSNQTEPGSFPFSVWAKLSRNILSTRQAELMTNPPAGGVMELRSAIARHLSAFRGLNVQPEQVIIGAGTEYLYGLLILLLGFDKTYAFENPGYRKFEKILKEYGVHSVAVAVDEQGLSVDELEKTGADVAHATVSHHFPTGITMPIARRSKLLSWAAEKTQETGPAGGDAHTEAGMPLGRYIIEDDYDSEFRMTGRPLPALAGMDPYGCVIYMNTFTKSLSSTVRVSYMILPEKLLDEFQRRLGFYSCTVSTFEQYTLSEFIEQGYFEKHINRMRMKNRKKRDRMLKLIAEGPLGKKAEISGEDAGLNFLLRIKSKKSPGQIQTQLEEQGIRLPLLEDGRTFLVNYSSVPMERIETAIRIMAQTANQDDGRSPEISR